MIILGILSLICSKVCFLFLNDPEGANLLVVIGLALILFFLFVAMYVFLPSITGLKRRQLAPLIVLLIYIVILIKVMVFKSVPNIRVGHLMLNFSGTDANGHANLIPFRTIGPYLLGYKGWIIAGINLIGNIIFLIPIGFLLPFVYRSMTWKKSLMLAIASGLAIELLQTILHVGIFDIDDVILNALGVMIGFWIFLVLARILRPMKPKNKGITMAILVVAAIAIVWSIFTVFQISFSKAGQDQMQRFDTGAGDASQNGDLCGGTGGTGEIVSVGNDSIVMKLHDDKIQTVHVTKQTAIKTSTGPASITDLKTGDHATLVGGPNPDGSFAADAVFVCNP